MSEGALLAIIASGVLFIVLAALCILYYVTKDARDEKKSKKRCDNFEQNSQQNLKNKIKKNKCINYTALKFEYIDLYHIIQEEVQKLSNFYNHVLYTNELYLVNLHKYYQEMSKDNSFVFMTDDRSFIFKLACFYKAILDEPIFIDDYSEESSYSKEVNEKLVYNVVKAVKSKIKLIRTKENYKKRFREYYDKNRNDVYLIACSIVDMM